MWNIIRTLIEFLFFLLCAHLTISDQAIIFFISRKDNLKKYKMQFSEGYFMY